MSKWNHKLRVFVFERIVREYGTLKEWQGTGTPVLGKGERKKYFDYLEQIRLVLLNTFGVEVKSVYAIQQQILFAMQDQKEYKSNGMFITYIKNTSAALEAGFISQSDLPNRVIVEHNKVSEKTETIESESEMDIITIL